MIQRGAIVEGRYHVRDLLGHGGMADVFQARDSRLDRDVAIKAFRTGDGDVRRFTSEARILAGFDHPNLIRVLDSGTVGDQPFVVLDLVSGPTLAHRLMTGPLADDQARRVGADVAGALGQVHAGQVVHRDVKPSNILLASDGRALLGDFGIAVVLDATRFAATAPMAGTAAYLAPEQVADGAVTPAAAIYSLGLVLLEALTGQRAFTGTPQEMIAARLTRDPSVRPDLPEPWPALLAGMTAREPERRPTAATVHARLQYSPLRCSPQCC
ncbi:MAG: serine/threonine-protein kinase [Actinomycetota bacterium]